MKFRLISLALVVALGGSVTSAEAETHSGSIAGVTVGWERGEIAARIETQPIASPPAQWWPI